MNYQNQSSPPPPPYSPTQDQYLRQTYNPRQSHPTIYTGYQNQEMMMNGGEAAQYYSGSPTSTEPLSASSSNRFNSPTDNNQTDRGLGGLIVGLGAAAMINNAMNQQNQQQNLQYSQSMSSSNGLVRGRSSEDPLSVLSRYDTILLVDDSASMSEGSRWREAALAVAGLADALVRYDTDGIDVYFMNSTEYLRNARSSQEVNMLFQRVRPVGLSTPTDLRVEELLGSYLERLEASKAQNLPPLKPLNLIVITDGEADDPDTLAYALVGFAERLDQGRFPLNQLGVQFIQIGKDKAATRALKNLDDELKSMGGARRDIVDTTPYKGTVTTDFMVKALLGGINKRIDRSS